MQKILLVVLIVVVVLIFIRRAKIDRIVSRTDDGEEMIGNNKLFDRLLYAIVVAIVIYLVVFSFRGRSSEGADLGEGGEYGLFGRKNKKVDEPKIPTRTNYGNPMKGQSYIPRSGIATTPKTDTSRIYRQFNV